MSRFLTWVWRGTTTLLLFFLCLNWKVDFTTEHFLEWMFFSVTVILAALGIIIAVVGVVGYTQIAKQAKVEARKVAEMVAEREARKVAEPVARRTAEELAQTFTSDDIRRLEDELEAIQQQLDRDDKPSNAPDSS